VLICRLNGHKGFEGLKMAIGSLQSVLLFQLVTANGLSFNDLTLALFRLLLQRYYYLQRYDNAKTCGGYWH
jgi:hypothetical protein